MCEARCLAPCMVGTMCTHALGTPLGIAAVRAEMLPEQPLLAGSQLAMLLSSVPVLVLDVEVMMLKLGS